MCSETDIMVILVILLKVKGSYSASKTIKQDSGGRLVHFASVFHVTASISRYSHSSYVL